METLGRPGVWRLFSWTDFRVRILEQEDKVARHQTATECPGLGAIKEKPHLRAQVQDVSAQG